MSEIKSRAVDVARTLNDLSVSDALAILNQATLIVQQQSVVSVSDQPRISLANRDQAADLAATIEQFSIGLSGPPKTQSDA
jgi:hypothetical protein